MPITAAGQAAMAANAARGAQSRAAGHAQELEHALADLRLGDLAFTTWRRESHKSPRCGYVISVRNDHPDDDTTNTTVALLEVTQGGISYLTGRDATGPDTGPCDHCGRLEPGHWDCRILAVPVGDITEVHPATQPGTRAHIARKLVAALNSRTKVDDRWRSLAEWALTIGWRPREQTERLT